MLEKAQEKESMCLSELVATRVLMRTVGVIRAERDKVPGKLVKQEKEGMFSVLYQLAIASSF